MTLESGKSGDSLSSATNGFGSEHETFACATETRELNNPAPTTFEIKLQTEGEHKTLPGAESIERTRTATELYGPAETKIAEPVPGIVSLLLIALRSSVIATYWGCSKFVKSVFGYLYRYPSHAILNLLFLGVISLLVVMGSRLHDRFVLSQISESTISRIIEVSRYTRDHDSEEVSRIGVSSFLRVGAPEWMQREAVKAVLYHAKLEGLSIVDQAVLLATVEVESGYNPMARAPTTSACGLFQFVRGTGQLFGLSPSECMDPWRNAEAGIQHYLANYREKIEPKVAELRGPEKIYQTFVASYFMHHDGPDARVVSPEVKTVILDGTNFLFRAYQVLKDEEQSATKRPSFLDSFSEVFWEVVGPIREMSESISQDILNATII